MNRHNWLMMLGMLVAVLLVALGVYLYVKATPYPAEIDHGPSPEAQANPYLAAEHYLRKQGLVVSHANGIDVLPSLEPHQHSLLLLGDRYNMSPRQIDQLMNWTRAGGRLLFVAQSLWDENTGQSNDLLLDRVQLHQSLSKDLKDPPPDGDKDPYPQLTKLYLENEDAPAYIDFDTDYHLFDSKDLAHAWANSADTTHMLQLSQGDGLLTVVTDSWIWQNAHIGDYDNAWLLWYLTQDREVTLLYRADHDDLFSLLLRHFPEALLALSLLLAAGLWAAGLRQGPLQPVPERQRRQLQEHLRSSADFLLRHAGQRHLLQALQRDIQRRARMRHPGFDRLGVAEQWQVLGRMTRLTPSAISQAMRPIADRRLSASEFTRQVAHLQTLRNVL